MKAAIAQTLRESIAVKQRLLEQVDAIEQATRMVVDSLRGGGKVVLFGNGGSASDAQHIAAELVGRFEADRPGLPAMALSTNTSSVTAIANDYGYTAVFARQVQALVREGDVVIGISTSGNSPNVIEGLIAAREQGARTIALSGKDGGLLRDVADLSIVVPSANTARIQEAHITIGHVICQMVEQAALSDASLYQGRQIAKTRP